MSSYTVLSATQKKTLPTSNGRPARQILNLLLQDGPEQKQAEWFTNADTPLPQQGQSLEGELTFNSEHNRWDFKRPKPAGFGAPRPEDPVRAARILRQHSQHMALMYVELKLRFGKTDDFSFDDIRKLTDAFDSDAKAVQP
jgi:hypothetical protein